jgi:hypothetical protein
MAKATLDDVIHRLKLNNRNTNRALRMSTKEQAEAFGSVMGAAVTLLSGAFDTSISRLVSTPAPTVNSKSDDNGLYDVDSDPVQRSSEYSTESKFDEIIITLDDGFKNLINAITGDRLEAAEARRESRMEVKRRPGLLASAGQGVGSAASGFGGLFGGLGGLLGGAGIGGGALLGGLGVAGVGAGAALGGVAALLLSINNLDGAAVRANVGEILAIKDDVESAGDVAAVGATLFALGTGLAFFGAGSTIAGLSDALTNFTNANFAQSIRDNVVTLLSIPEAVGGKLDMLLATGPVALALSGLGIGIGLFGLGSIAAGAGDAIGNFTSANWAQNIKDNVLTLLSIPDAAGGKLDMLLAAGPVALALSGLGVGLAIFGVGSTVGVTPDVLNNFMNANWAESIKNNVVTLLSIKDEMGGNWNMLADTGFFVATMTGLAAGLLAFTVGQGAQQMSQTLDKFGERGFTQTIRDNISDLISISDMIKPGQAVEFAKEMGIFATGLAAISAGELVNQLTGASSKILSFFGVKSPIEKILEVAGQSGEIREASDGLKSMAEALQTFASIKLDVKDADFEGLTKNISKALPLIRDLSEGKSKRFGEDIPSILDPSLRLPEMVIAMRQIRNVVGVDLQPGSESVMNTMVPMSGVVKSETIKTKTLEVADAMKTQSINVIAPTSQDNSVTQQNNTMFNDIALSTFDPLDNY